MNFNIIITLLNQKAHPNNNTNMINIEYQQICLDLKYNSMEDFEYVKKIGLSHIHNKLKTYE